MPGSCWDRVGGLRGVARSFPGAWEFARGLPRARRELPGVAGSLLGAAGGKESINVHGISILALHGISTVYPFLKISSVSKPMVLSARGICARYTRGKQGVASLFCVCFLFVLSTVYPHSIGSGKYIYIYARYIPQYIYYILATTLPKGFGREPYVLLLVFLRIDISIVCFFEQLV